MVSKGFPNVTTSSGQQYNIGREALRYTVHLHSPCSDIKNTIKDHSKSRCTIYFDYSNNMVLEKGKVKIKLMLVYR